MTTDPLGLTEEQRRVSDFNERYGTWAGNALAAFPGEIPRIERACGYCRRYGHTEGECPTVIQGEWS